MEAWGIASGMKRWHAWKHDGRILAEYYPEGRYKYPIHNGYVLADGIAIEITTGKKVSPDSIGLNPAQTLYTYETDKFSIIGNSVREKSSKKSLALPVYGGRLVDVGVVHDRYLLFEARRSPQTGDDRWKRYYTLSCYDLGQL